MKNKRINKLLNIAEKFKKENDGKKTKEEINEEISDLLNKLENKKIELFNINKIISLGFSNKKYRTRKKFTSKKRSSCNRINDIEKRLKELGYKAQISKPLKIIPKKESSIKTNIKINIKKNKNNVFLLKKKIRTSLAELKKLNQLIVKQQKLQKNIEAISTQAKIDKLKNKLKEYGEQYSNIPKIKKNFIPDHWEKANLSSSLAIMRGSGLIYSPINSQAQRQTKGYKKRKKNKKKNF